MADLISWIPGFKQQYERWEKIKHLLVNISEMQEELKESAHTFRAIFCVSPIPMTVVGVEDAVLHEVNSAFEEMTGYTRGELIGKSLFDLGFYANINDRHRVVSKVLDTGHAKYELIDFRMKDGTTVKIVMSSKLICRKGKMYMISVFEPVMNGSFHFASDRIGL